MSFARGLRYGLGFALVLWGVIGAAVWAALTFMGRIA